MDVEDVELATLEWVWSSNHHRLFGPIGDIPPIECEQACYHRSSEALDNLCCTQVKWSPANPGRF